MCIRSFSVSGSLWLALIVITIFIVLDLRLLGAGRRRRAGAEHRTETERGEVTR